MDETSLARVNEALVSQFPYLKDVQPQIKALIDSTFELRYEGSAQTADGHSLSLRVCVHADADGKILKLTTSK